MSLLQLHLKLTFSRLSTSPQKGFTMKGKLSIFVALLLAVLTVFLAGAVSGWFILLYLFIGWLYGRYYQLINQYESEIIALLSFSLIWGALVLYAFLVCWTKNNRGKGIFQMFAVALRDFNRYPN